jgi:hypothetical protein
MKLSLANDMYTYVYTDIIQYIILYGTMVPDGTKSYLRMYYNNFKEGR